MKYNLQKIKSKKICGILIISNLLLGCNAGTPNPTTTMKSANSNESATRIGTKNVGAVFKLAQGVIALTRLLNIIRISTVTSAPLAAQLSSVLQETPNSTLYEILYMIYNDAYSPLFSDNKYVELTLAQKIIIINAIGNKLGIIADGNPDQFARVIINKYDEEASFFDDSITTLMNKTFISVGLYQLYALLLVEQMPNASIAEIKALLNQSNNILQNQGFCDISNSVSNYFNGYDESCANAIQNFLNASYPDSLINELINQKKLKSPVSEATSGNGERSDKPINQTKVSFSVADKVKIEPCANYIVVLQLTDSKGAATNDNNITVKLSYNAVTSKLEGSLDAAKMVDGGVYSARIIKLLPIEEYYRKFESQPMSLLSLEQNSTTSSLSSAKSTKDRPIKCDDGYEVVRINKVWDGHEFVSSSFACIPVKEDKDIIDSAKDEFKSAPIAVTIGISGGVIGVVSACGFGYYIKNSTPSTQGNNVQDYGTDIQESHNSPAHDNSINNSCYNPHNTVDTSTSINHYTSSSDNVYSSVDTSTTSINPYY